MRIIAFITEAVDARAILEHIGEPATAPSIAQARGPPEWYEDATENVIDADDLGHCMSGEADSSSPGQRRYDSLGKSVAPVL